MQSTLLQSFSFGNFVVCIPQAVLLQMGLVRWQQHSRTDVLTLVLCRLPATRVASGKTLVSSQLSRIFSHRLMVDGVGAGSSLLLPPA